MSPIIADKLAFYRHKLVEEQHLPEEKAEEYLTQLLQTAILKTTSDMLERNPELGLELLEAAESVTNPDSKSPTMSEEQGLAFFAAISQYMADKFEVLASKH